MGAEFKKYIGGGPNCSTKQKLKEFYGKNN